MNNDQQDEFKQRLSDIIVNQCMSQIDGAEFISGEVITKEEIDTIFQSNFGKLPNDRVKLFSDSDIEYMLFRLGSRAVRVVEEHRPIYVKGDKVKEWLHETKIEWNHWDAYKQLLQSEGKSEDVISEHERVIDAALDMSGNPMNEGTWPPRKGLIMGNVQAGKTMNFIGLLNKSLDVGYHTIIVLGGHMDELRKQAQIRIDEGVIGRDTSRLEVNDIDISEQSGPIGVAKFLRPGVERPTPITTRTSDFGSTVADSNRTEISLHPVVLVIKKNVRIMKTLIAWLKSYDMQSSGREKPMILIDDEADYASINTKADREEYAATNAAIKELLDLYEKPTYVGYTATPFANVFIPYKNTVSGELDDDLFPSDFMLKMPIPPNYQGQDAFFPAGNLIEDAPHVQRIDGVDDTSGWLPLKHKKDYDVNGLHRQLKEAIYYFVCVVAIRYSKGQTHCHNTMLVNVSRFNDVQARVAEEVQEFLHDIVASIDAYGYLDVGLAGEASPHIKHLHREYKKNFSHTLIPFQEIMSILCANIRRIKVEMINGLVKRSRSKPSGLDYEGNKDKGLWVIAVGGLKLSRGLTLEGLSVSFFLRNAMAYDTLTQMCRWFGYHPGFDDLCRLYLLEPSYLHYSTVAQSIRELYKELSWMQLSNGTPRDFGLKVRASETALLITAKNKQGTARKVDYHYILWGKGFSRLRAWSNIDRNQKNYEFLIGFINKLNREVGFGKRDGFASYVYKGVDYEHVIELMEKIDNPTASKLNEKGPAIEALKALNRAEISKPKVVIFSRQNPTSTKKTSNLVDSNGDGIEYKGGHTIENLDINLIARDLNNKNGQLYSSNVQVGDTNDLKCILDEKTEDSDLSNEHIRGQMDSPVLVVYLLAAIVKDKVEEKKYNIAHGSTPTVMYVVHFPEKKNAFKGCSKQQMHIPELDTNKSYMINEILQGIDLEDMMDEDS